MIDDYEEIINALPSVVTIDLEGRNLKTLELLKGRILEDLLFPESSGKASWKFSDGLVLETWPNPSGLDIDDTPAYEFSIYAPSKNLNVLYHQDGSIEELDLANPD